MRGGTPGFAQAVLALAGRDLLVRPAPSGWQVCDLSGRQPPRTLTAAQIVAEAQRGGWLPGDTAPVTRAMTVAESGAQLRLSL